MDRRKAAQMGYTPFILRGREVIENAIEAHKNNSIIELLGGEFRISNLDWEIGQFGEWTGVAQLFQCIPAAKPHTTH